MCETEPINDALKPEIVNVSFKQSFSLFLCILPVVICLNLWIRRMVIFGCCQIDLVTEWLVSQLHWGQYLVMVSKSDSERLLLTSPFKPISISWKFSKLGLDFKQKEHWVTILKDPWKVFLTAEVLSCEESCDNWESPSSCILLEKVLRWSTSSNKTKVSWASCCHVESRKDSRCP